MSIEDYIKAWPAGLIHYEVASTTRLPDQTLHFLREIGLPVKREPEWIFDGSIQLLSDGIYVFGKHFVTQLVLDQNGTVFEYDAGRMLFLNSGIQELAYCLTFRKKSSRGRFRIQTEEDFQRFQQAILELDPKALIQGSYWATYVDEIRDDMLEMQ